MMQVQRESPTDLMHFPNVWQLVTMLFNISVHRAWETPVQSRYSEFTRQDFSWSRQDLYVMEFPNAMCVFLHNSLGICHSRSERHIYIHLHVKFTWWYGQDIRRFHWIPSEFCQYDIEKKGIHPHMSASIKVIILQCMMGHLSRAIIRVHCKCLRFKAEQQLGCIVETTKQSHDSQEHYIECQDLHMQNARSHFSSSEIYHWNKLDCRMAL